MTRHHHFVGGEERTSRDIYRALLKILQAAPGYDPDRFDEDVDTIALNVMMVLDGFRPAFEVRYERPRDPFIQHLVNLIRTDFPELAVVSLKANARLYFLYVMNAKRRARILEQILEGRKATGKALGYPAACDIFDPKVLGNPKRRVADIWHGGARIMTNVIADDAALARFRHYFERVRAYAANALGRRLTMTVKTFPGIKR